MTGATCRSSDCHVSQYYVLELCGLILFLSLVSVNRS